MEPEGHIAKRQKTGHSNDSSDFTDPSDVD